MERAYDGARIHDLVPMRLEVGDGVAHIRFTATSDFHHAARSLHGSLCFKMLDDAAFFAVASNQPDRFWPTARFDVEFLRPVTDGDLVAQGRVVESDGKRASATAEIRDSSGALVARGSGTFARGRVRWSDAEGY